MPVNNDQVANAWADPSLEPSEPLIPDYRGACVNNVMRALIEPPEVIPEWFPPIVQAPDQVLVLELDGIGWETPQTRRALAQTLA